MKRPYKILITLLGAVALVVLVLVANIARSHSQVRGIAVDIRYSDIPHLVDSQVVVDSILTALPHLTICRVSEVNRSAVAAAAAHVPYLCEVSSSVSVSGKVVVRASQRRPIARLFYGSREYYFDAEGCLMPPSPQADCDVLVAGGRFTEPLRPDSLNSQMQALVTVARYLTETKRYRGLFDQIFVESNGDIVLVPKVGAHIVELGPVDDQLDSKFANLWIFYQRGMPRAGWNTYSKISLKYNGQVVCTRDKS